MRTSNPVPSAALFDISIKIAGNLVVISIGATSFNLADTASVTSSILIKNCTLNPGQTISSCLDFAQKPSRK